MSIQKYLAVKFEASLTVKAEAISAGLSPAEKAAVKVIERQI